jgi:hypothetical protein
MVPCLIGFGALRLQATIMIPNPIIIIIQVELSGTGDATRGGVEVVTGSGIGAGSPTEITGVGDVSGVGESVGTVGESVGTVGESVGTVGESVGTVGESVDAVRESVGVVRESISAVCKFIGIVTQDAEVTPHWSERALKSITLLCGTGLLPKVGVIGAAWVSWLVVDIVPDELGLVVSLLLLCDLVELLLDWFPALSPILQNSSPLCSAEPPPQLATSNAIGESTNTSEALLALLPTHKLRLALVQRSAFF